MGWKIKRRKTFKGRGGKRAQIQEARGKFRVFKCRKPALVLFAWPKSCGWRKDSSLLTNESDESTLIDPQKGPGAPFGLSPSPALGFSISRHRRSLYCWLRPGSRPSTGSPRQQSATPKLHPSESGGSRCLALCATRPGKLEVWLAPRPAHFQELAS